MDSCTEDRQCPKHGRYTAISLYIADEHRWTDCPACETERTAKIQHRTAAAQHRGGGQTLERRLASVGIFERFLSASLESYRATNIGQQTALQAATSYASTFAERRKSGDSMIFTGDVGTGKTHLACGIMRVVLSRGYTAIKMNIGKAMRSVKATYGDDRTMSEGQAIDRLVKPDLLVLDEIGDQRGTATEHLILSEIIDARHERCRPVICITNLTLSECEPLFGARVMSRMRQHGSAVVAFDWEDYRLTMGRGV